MHEKEEKADFIKWISELDQSSLESVGQKAANLGELHKIGVQVPDGFIITTEACDFFREKTKLNSKISSLISKTGHHESSGYNELAKKIIELIISTEIPSELESDILEAYENLSFDGSFSLHEVLKKRPESIFVAVRSSFVRKTNEHSSEKNIGNYINIKRGENLLENIKRCLASRFTPEFLENVVKNNIHNYWEGFAIIIQKMIDSEKSGVVFSTNPEKQDGSVLIEAILGLNYRIMPKTIFPDKYFVSRSLHLLDKKISDKRMAVTRNSGGQRVEIKLTEEKSKTQALKENEIRKLSEIALKIEEHYHKPQEIDFAIENGEIFVVQTKDLKTFTNINETPGQPVEIINASISNNSAKTKINLIVDSESSVEDGLRMGIKEAGLIKIEAIISESGKHPEYFLNERKLEDYEKIIFNGVWEFAKNLDKLWIRTSNMRTDEYSWLGGAPKAESNPLLGNSGIRYGIKNPEILKAELKAVKRISSQGKEIGILLPKVISVEEVRTVRNLLSEIEFSNAKLGVIVETPAAVQIIKDLCKEGVSLISISTENLTQAILSLDKENQEVRDIYDEMNPAVLYQIDFVIRVCKRENVETSIFHDSQIKREMVKFLVEKGIDTISVNSHFVKDVVHYISGPDKNIHHSEGTQHGEKKLDIF